MPASRQPVLFVISLALFALSACGSSARQTSNAAALLSAPHTQRRTTPRQAPAPGLALPSPQELLASDRLSAPARHTSQQNFLLWGYDGALPNKRVGVSLDSHLVMDPNFTPGSLEGLAFCIYSLAYSPGDFAAGSIALHLKSADVILRGQAKDLYVGYANYVTNRWDWFNFPDIPGATGPDALGAYTPPGGADKFHFALVSVGKAKWELNSGYIGLDPPLYDFKALPDSGQAPLDVQFTVTPSAFPVQVWNTIEWDWEGDGLYDSQTAGDLLQQDHVYLDAGSYNPTVRVTDTEGLNTVQSVAVSVSKNLTHTWGTSADERALGIASDSAGNIYVCGKGSSSGLLLKFNALMALQWSKAWKPADAGAFAEYHDLVCIGTDVYVTGFVNAHDGLGNDRDILLHKYDASGSLLLQKTYGDASNDDEGTALATDGTNLYLTGYVWDTSDGAFNVLAAKLGLDGSILWAKHDGLIAAAPFYTAGTAVAYWPAAGSVAILAGPQDEFATSPACVLWFDYSDGSGNGYYYYSDSEDPSLVLTGAAIFQTSDNAFHLVGNSDNGFDTGIFSCVIAPVGGAASSFQLANTFAAVAPGAAAVDPTAGEGTFIYGGGDTTDAAVTYDPLAAGDLPFDQLGASGSFFSQVFDVAAPGGHVYLACGYADHSDATHWDRDTAFLDSATHTIEKTAAAFVFTDWTANAADTAITPTDIVGTMDSGAGGQDILVARLNPAL